MSAILDAKRAIERRLSTAFPTTAIAYENANFTAPAGLYIRTSWKINKPTDDTVGTNCYRENITFIAFVCDVLNKGTSNAIAVAEQIRTLFYKRLSLQENTTRIHVLKQPEISSAGTSADRLVVPVMISLTVEVNQ